MQNVKDTFYQLLRSRLATLNPSRTITLRGLTRPGILVEENELPTEATLPDCFRLRWTALTTDTNGPLPTITQRCEILYETAGIALNNGMDRGRSLAAMDAELLTLLAPGNTLKTSYKALANGGAPQPLSTNI